MNVESKRPGSYRDKAVSEISELRNVRIAEIFPTLFHCSTTKIDGPQLNERAVNALRWCQCDKWGDLLALTVGDLWSVHNAGRLTIERILAAAREQADRYSGAPTLRVPGTRRSWSRPPSLSLYPSFVFISILGLLISRVVLLLRSENGKDAEILALRHQLTVLQRQVQGPRFTRADRSMLAILAKALRRDRLNTVFRIVTPATVLGCGTADLSHTAGHIRRQDQLGGHPHLRRHVI